MLDISNPARLTLRYDAWLALLRYLHYYSYLHLYLDLPKKTSGLKTKTTSAASNFLDAQYQYTLFQRLQGRGIPSYAGGRSRAGHFQDEIREY